MRDLYSKLNSSFFVEYNTRDINIYNRESTNKFSPNSELKSGDLARDDFK